MEGKQWYEVSASGTQLTIRVFDQEQHLARVVKLNQPADGTAPYDVSVQIFESDPNRRSPGLAKRTLKVIPDKDQIDDSQGGRVGQIIVE